MKQRNVTFDIVKALVIWLMVIGHLLDGSSNLLLYIIYSFHMPLFFVVSGYFAGGRTEPWRVSLRKKVTGLLVPYWIWSSISFLIHAAQLLWQRHPEQIGEEALGIFVYARSVWFLLILFLTAVLFDITARVARRCHIPLALAELMLWLLLAAAYHGEILRFGKWVFLFPFYLTGYGLRAWVNRTTDPDKPRSVSPSVQWWLPPVSVLAWAGYAALVWWTYRPDAYSFYHAGGLYNADYLLTNGMYFSVSLLGVLCAFLTAEAIRHTGGRAAPLIGRVGIYSLDIYVIHMIGVSALSHLFIRLVPNVPLREWCLYPAAALVICVVITILSDRILRRWKLYRVAVGGRPPAPRSNEKI
ncbi:MAG: acyltransferase family protein [Clostridia bacterium]|nr:acyltransferase family protein [Clostridia bacterium]